MWLSDAVLYSRSFLGCDEAHGRPIARRCRQDRPLGCGHRAFTRQGRAYASTPSRRGDRGSLEAGDGVPDAAAWSFGVPCAQAFGRISLGQTARLTVPPDARRRGGRDALPPSARHGPTTIQPNEHGLEQSMIGASRTSVIKFDHRSMIKFEHLVPKDNPRPQGLWPSCPRANCSN